MNTTSIITIITIMILYSPGHGSCFARQWKVSNWAGHDGTFNSYYLIMNRPYDFSSNIHISLFWLMSLNIHPYPGLDIKWSTRLRSVKWTLPSNLLSNVTSQSSWRWKHMFLSILMNCEKRQKVECRGGESTITTKLMAGPTEGRIYSKNVVIRGHIITLQYVITTPATWRILG